MDLERISQTLSDADPVRAIGRLRSAVGLSIQADIPGVRLGELVEIERRDAAPLPAEVVGFRDQSATLLPLGRAEGLGPDDLVRPVGRALAVRFDEGLLGRVLDGLGQPLDDGPELTGDFRPVTAEAPSPVRRPRVDRPLGLGVRVLDAFTPVGEGQRLGLFSGSGVGKSRLLGQIARQAEADVFVACLVGERGRELGEFLDDALGADGRARGVVVCATADAPPLVRMKCPYVATAIAEGFRDQGKRVLLLMDSVTRYARAAREVGLAAGEPAARRGYPPSVFASLPRLVERSGNAERGSITAFYTVLVEGDDLDEPIADELRGLLDGHVVLSRQLAARGQYPAVDVVRSLSRVAERVAPDRLRRAAAAVRAHVAIYEDKRDLVLLGAYTPGSDEKLDAALVRIEAIQSFLRQPADENCAPEETLRRLEALV